ncbi:hypothetical protein [Anaeroarcus burkinensis]|uniref:hypothetical protein n=1 Tax=Anaeroarcus burkinensis TaxID=82376 RepID=UPI00048896EF|nr:hypothetical protein [Anaeroarcus burkinensis]
MKLSDDFAEISCVCDTIAILHGAKRFCQVGEKNLLEGKIDVLSAVTAAVMFLPTALASLSGSNVGAWLFCNQAMWTMLARVGAHAVEQKTLDGGKMDAGWRYLRFVFKGAWNKERARFFVDRLAELASAFWTFGFVIVFHKAFLLCSFSMTFNERKVN